MSALEGLLVVDLSTTMTGAHVSQLLGDFGAEVVMVEPVDGSPLREQAASPFWARGKKSIELNLKDSGDAAAAKRLAEQADVIVETWRPGVARETRSRVRGPESDQSRTCLRFRDRVRAQRPSVAYRRL